MVTIRNNSSSIILAQANAFLNRPVVKKTAVALTGLALAGAVATLAYNKFFQNVQIDPCQPMSSNSFPYPTYPQPMSSNSFPYPTYPQPIALQATNQTAENRTLAATPSVAENNTELKVQPVQSQNVTNKETLSGSRIVFKNDFKSKENFSLFDKIIYGAIDFGSAAVDTTSNIVQKASAVLTEARNLGYETIFPRF